MLRLMLMLLLMMLWPRRLLSLVCDFIKNLVLVLVLVRCEMR